MAALKILAVEDEEVTRKLISVGLRDEQQFELCLVPNGEDALEEYKRFRPDIVLLDIMMPHMNGYKVLQEIRTNLKDQKTTIIMISSVSEKSEIMACVKLGIQGYILKPFHAKALAETVLQYHRKAKAASVKPQNGKAATTPA
ncbi:MAG TPA: response regulator [Desulfurivibrionaceae bacterium]|nr:response regulator [Desulfurivibrionaceae bacterium]